MNTTLLVYSFAAFAALGCAQPPQDFGPIQIKTTKVSSNFYTLEGAGGTIGVLVGSDGVFMVDCEYGPLSEKITAAIRQITDKPIRFMVNTHVHPDHTGGNENFAKAGTIIFSRDELRWRLAHPAPSPNGTPGTPAPAAALPMITYEGPVTLYMDDEEIQLIPIRQAHTDGDTLVRFVSNDILMTGDFFRSLGYPNIDRANGGTLSGLLDAVGITIGMAGPHTKIIPGHGAPVDRAYVIAHRDMILAIRDKVEPLVQQGKTVDEVIAAKPTSDYDGTVLNAAASSTRFLRGLYAELKSNN